MKMKISLMALFVVLFLSCGTSNVQTVKTTDKNLGTYNTFAYLPNSNVDVPGKNYNDENVNASIITAINENMRQAGYRLDRDNPDLLVLISTETDTEIETTTDPVYATYPYTATTARVRPFYNSYYYRGYNTYNNVVGYDTDSYRYQEGTLSINLVDRESQEIVWKGIATDAIYDRTSTEAIKDMVRDVFEEYPLNNR